MIANIVKDLVGVPVTIATGLVNKAAATVKCVVRLELDGDADDGKYWRGSDNSWQAIGDIIEANWPNTTTNVVGEAIYQLPAAASLNKVSATKPARIFYYYTDSALGAETLRCVEREEMIYSTGAAEAAVGSVASAAVKKNTALANLTFLMTLARSPVVGAAVTATVRQDAGAFAGSTNAVVEIGNGIYSLSLTAAEMNGTVVTLRMTAVTADDLVITIPTQA